MSICATVQSRVAEQPAQVSQTLSTSTPEPEKPLGARVGAAIVDVLILTIVLLAVGAIRGDTTAGDGRIEAYAEGWAFVLYVGVVLLYHFSFEATIGRTPGKLLVGVRVVGADGRRASVWRIAVRTILRLVDWLPFLYLAGFVAVTVSSDRRQRLGDQLAETSVVRTTPIRYRGVAWPVLVILLIGGLNFVLVRGSSDRVERMTGPDASFTYPGGWRDQTAELDAQAIPPNPVVGDIVRYGKRRNDRRG